MGGHWVKEISEKVRKSLRRAKNIPLEFSKNGPIPIRNRPIQERRGMKRGD